MAVHVCYKSLYISLPSSAKQQREMTNSKERDLTLDRGIDIGIANELSDRNNSDPKEEVLGIEKGALSKKDSKSGIESYRNCGGNHAAKRNSCPTFGKKCLHCGKPNHFEKVCPSKRDGVRRSTRDRRRRPRRSVQTVDPQFPTGQDDDLFVIDATTSKPRKKSKIYCTMEINGQPVEIKIDTGAKCNVITLDIFEKIYRKKKIDKTKAVQLVAYSGDTLTTLGSAKLEVHLPSMSRNLEFHVIDKPVTPLLRLTDSLSLNLIQLHSEVHEVDTTAAFRAAILDEYEDLFQGDLGNIPVVYKMRLDANVIPVIRSSRRISLAMEESVKRELDRTVKIGAITPLS